MNNYNLKPLVGKTVSKEELTESAVCMIPLFHGTDMALLQMTQNERAVLREDCGFVIDYLLPVYINCGFENLSSQEKHEILGTAHVPVLNAFSKAGLRQNCRSLYQYKNVYLTFDPYKAYIYAQNASVCGELGYIAHWLLYGIDFLKYPLPLATERQKSALHKVTEASLRQPNPAIMMYLNVPKNRLRTEKDEEVNWEWQIDAFLNNWNHGVVRVMGEFDIAKGSHITLQDLPTA